MNYHAHVYYTSETRPIASSLRERFIDTFKGMRVTPMIDRPVGPHPLWMFNMVFEASQLEQMKQWLDERRQGLSVLIHPDTEDDYHSHTEGALWLGDPVALNLSALN